MGRATSPPYDVISNEERDRLLARSPHNIVRLLLPGTDQQAYERAGALLAAWQRDQVLRADPLARFYVYEIEYPSGHGERKTARGVVGALELQPLGERVVPHEETMDKHRADRLSLLKTTQANLDPIIALSGAPQLRGLLAVPDAAPRLGFIEDDGSLHRLFEITDADVESRISAAVASHPISIADGHHRYTTALSYLEGRDTPVAHTDAARFIMAVVAPFEGSGLTVGPYHRLLPRKEGELDLAPLSAFFDVVPGQAAVPNRPGSLVVVHHDAAYHLHPLPGSLEALPGPWREASAAVAREILYPLLGVSDDDVRYSADADAAIAASAAGAVAVLVAPVTEAAIAAAGEMGLRFPAKTTYFIPKPRAGLVVRCFDTD